MRPASRNKVLFCKEGAYTLFKKKKQTTKKHNTDKPPPQAIKYFINIIKNNKAQLDPRSIFKLQFHIIVSTGIMHCSFHRNENAEAHNVL